MNHFQIVHHNPLQGGNNMNLSISKITEFITEHDKDDLTLDKCFLKTVLTKSNGDKMIVNNIPLFENYLNELGAEPVYITMDETRLDHYAYNPKLFSYDIYGTTELWFMILQINEMHSVSEFYKPKIKTYSSRIINQLLEIFDLEKDEYERNYSEITNTLI